MKDLVSLQDYEYNSTILGALLGAHSAGELHTSELNCKFYIWVVSLWLPFLFLVPE